MLYLLRPHLPLVWNGDVPWKVALAAEKQGADLSQLDWASDTDQVLDDFKIRVAVRHGIACPPGIVVEGLNLRAGGEGNNLRTIGMQSQEMHKGLREQDTLMERLMPGWKAGGDELDARIAEQNEKEARHRDAKARALLDVAPKPALVTHWLQLGGALPNPI